MKTKTKSTAKKQYGKSHTHRAQAPGKKVEDRDLNADEQDRITNARNDEYSEDNERFQRTDDVDAEEEREKKRKVEDARGEEEK